MRILLCSWEFPPVTVGGLGGHVAHLAGELAAAGHDVVVLTRADAAPGARPQYSASPGSGPGRLRVLRVAEDPPPLSFSEDLVAWVMALNHALLRAALTTVRDWVPDVVHAHDWLVGHCAIALAETLERPLVTTIHATEAGRHSGWLGTPLTQQVHGCEWWLANRSDRLIACSHSMADEVRRLFGAPTSGSAGLSEITVIPNGVDAEAWSATADGALPPHPSSPRSLPPSRPPRLLFVGRLEYEKGVHDLLAALPLVRAAHPGLRLTLAGDGTCRAWLHRLAWDHGIARAVTFTGRLSAGELRHAFAHHDLCVVPSRYEPFGLVALEAAASGIPLVATATGGLADIVRDGATGRSAALGDPAGLAAAMMESLADPEGSARCAQRARDEVRKRYRWDRIATTTLAVYAAAATAGPRRAARPVVRPHAILRPLPDRDP